MAELYKIYPVYDDYLTCTTRVGSCIKRVYAYQEHGKTWLTTLESVAIRSKKMHSG